MADEIRRSGNPFLKAADQIRLTAPISTTRAEPRNRSTPKALLNYIPETDALSGMVDKALSALSRGVRWARGSILNLLV